MKLDDKTVQLMLAAQQEIRSGSKQRAADLLQNAMKHQPLFAGSYLELANLLVSGGQVADAVTLLDSVPQTVNKDPALLDAYSGLLLKTGQFELAVRACKQLLKRQPTATSPVYMRLSQCHEKLEQYDKAIAAARQAEAEGHNTDIVAVQLATCLALSGDYKAACQQFERVSESVLRDDMDVRYRYALVLLECGRFKEALPLYVDRWGTPYFTRPGFLEGLTSIQPGDKGARILAVCEQGIGDQILQCAALAFLFECFDEVYLVCDVRLHALLARTWGDRIHCLDEHDEPGNATVAAATGQYCCLADWLISALANERDFPSPWMQPDEKLVCEYRQNLAKVFPGKKLVGISWGSANPNVGKQKTIPLKYWGALFAEPECAFVNLQYGDVDRLLCEAEGQFSVNIYRVPGLSIDTQIDELVALVKALDYVITTSSVTAHVAGVAGISGSVMLTSGRGALWHWAVWDGSAPWYPSLALVKADDAGSHARSVKLAVERLRR